MIELLVIFVSLSAMIRVANKSFYAGFSLYFVLVLTARNYPNGFMLVSLGGFSVGYADLVFMSSSFLFFRSIGSIRSINPYLLKMLLALSFAIQLSLTRGIVEYGIPQAVNEARVFLHSLGALYWFAFSTARFRLDINVLRKVAIFGSISLLVIATVNISTYGLGSASSNLQISDLEIVNLRPLVSIQAMALLGFFTILLIEIIENREHRWFHLALITLGGAGILVSQQRSVWVATLFTLIALILFRKSFRTGLAILITLVFFVFFVPLIQSPIIDASIVPQIQDSATNLSTYLARNGSWNQYLESFLKWPLLDQLIGKPFGSGWGRYDGLNNIWVEFNPHNWYIMILMRIGLIGLGIFICYYVVVLNLNFKSSRGAPASFLLQTQLLVFQNFYPMPWQVLQPFAPALTRPDQGDNKKSGNSQIPIKWSS